jgi:hypothetical protein
VETGCRGSQGSPRAVVPSGRHLFTRIVIMIFAILIEMASLTLKLLHNLVDTCLSPSSPREVTVYLSINRRYDQMYKSASEQSKKFVSTKQLTASRHCV